MISDPLTYILVVMSVLILIPFMLILAGYIYGGVEAYRDDTSDSTETHD